MSPRGASTEELWAELLGLVKSASRIPAAPKRTKETAATRTKRRRKIEAALKARDLEKVRDALPVAATDAENEAQLTVIYAYAAVLEVSSACLSILFERFSGRELRDIEAALADIGARETLRDLRRLTRALAAALARGKRRGAAVEWLMERPLRKTVDRRASQHVDEMEKALLRYCRTNLDELAPA